MEHIKNYKKIYLLQDQFLEEFFKLNKDFYLTGGTCLHRFYFKERYSDDLDLFVNASDTFNSDLRYILNQLSKKFDITTIIHTATFHRIELNKNNLRLKIDFVNDLPYRPDKIQKRGNINIDSILNILINKISAILSRDEPKDVFDLITIALNYSFNWDNVLSLTRKKTGYELETLLFRLSSFPISSLKYINAVEQTIIQNAEKLILTIIKDIERNNYNSLK